MEPLLAALQHMRSSRPNLLAQSIRLEIHTPSRNLAIRQFIHDAKWHALSVPFLLVLVVSAVVVMTSFPSWLHTFPISLQYLIFLS